MNNGSAMQSLRGFGEWLKGAAKVPWGKLAEKSITATKATADLGKTWREAAPKIETLKDLDRIDSFFQLLDLPVAKLAVSTLPFASVGIELLRLYWDVTKTEPTFESSVALAAQMAYLESLQGVLARADEQTRAALETVRLAEVFERQLQKSELIVLNKTRAKKTLTQLRRSELGEAFDEALGELLVAAGLADWQVRVFVDQVAWGTPKYFHGVVADLKDEVEPLDAFLRSDGLRIQEKFDSVEDYLKEKIDPLPLQKVFDEETVTFSGLYVSLTVQPLDIGGQEMRERPVGVEEWAKTLLEQSEPRKIGFIEGEAGRGKSVFCRMFAAMVRVALYPSFIPILIRLRDVRELENNLTQTLETHLQDLDFVQSDGGWLTDENTRFLLIFDGFDELLLQGRESGGLKELVQQIGDFQKKSHHQCLVTGRPLALQGVDRMLSQTKNLVRVRLEPMADAQRAAWLQSWAKLFGSEEAENFRSFLAACPADIGGGLAREPLLLYLLGRLHREGHLKAEMFARTVGIQAKVRVYDESVRWVLERQRQELNDSISGLETEDLRQVLQEAALCVVQSGNETAKLTMLKSRFTDSANPVAELLKQAQRETEKTEDKALNNLLTAFYFNPGEKDRAGSVEFTHKSFGEFLFAERLKRAFDAWAEVDERNRLQMDDDNRVAQQIYDLLGYGALTIEVVKYVKEMILVESELDGLVELYQRLYRFYTDWCNGLYIDKRPNKNLPQLKMIQMNKAGIAIGLRQVDIYAGLNVMILLFELHRYGQQQELDSNCLWFHPCLSLEAKDIDKDIDRRQLLRIIGYSQITGVFSFTTPSSFAEIMEHYLSCTELSYIDLPSISLPRNLAGTSFIKTNLRGADLKGASLEKAKLMGADLSHANLIDADLRGANLRKANLGGANLGGVFFCGADLRDVDLEGANLEGAHLEGADLEGAYLGDAYFSDISWDAKTNWKKARSLGLAQNLPNDLKQQLGLV